ncbi:MAG TPA: DAK2 domain-containing protein [Prolixibacteraceae bacterium]|nr:DAK2 domain-containing protein [Prolixibacteraceae bacterium]
MLETIGIEHFKKMFDIAYSEVKANEQYFSELDAQTGDGDHGTAIVTALNAINNSMKQASDLKMMFTDAGFAAMSEASGSTSTLLGSWLMGMYDGVNGDEIDAKGVAIIFRAGLANMQKQTKATVGDKTLMDALVPAVEALERNLDAGIESMFAAATLAAEEGAEKTKALVAKYGRARNLRENVIGFMDPGAASMACIWGAFEKSIN